MNYYNTTNKQSEDLKESIKKAKSQRKKVLLFYKEFKELSASDVLKLYPCKNTPLTSIRRAITNLSNEGKIYKTKQKKIGFYKEPEHIYKLVD